jgi:hypothetical protein
MKMGKSVEECNAYSDGWNDKEAGAEPRPPTDQSLKKMYYLGYNDASDTGKAQQDIRS